MNDLTIIRRDGIIVVDGIPQRISMAGIDEDIHAIQFHEGKGEIEYISDKQNEPISDCSKYQFLIDRHAVSREMETNPFYGLNTNMAKHKALQLRLSEIDTEISAMADETFKFMGHNFYIDFGLIGGLAAVADVLDEDFSVSLKTADLEKDGITNVEIPIGKGAIKGLCGQMIKEYIGKFSYLNNKKTALKTLFKGQNSKYQDIMDAEV